MISSKDFNREYIVKVFSPLYTGLLGYYRLVDLLGVRASKVFSKLISCKSDKYVCKPFHGVTLVFYNR